MSPPEPQSASPANDNDTPGPDPGVIHYAAGGLDRAAWLREDPDALARALADPATRLVPVWRDLNLVVETAGGAMSAGRISAGNLDLAGRQPIFLGLEGDRRLFAADVSGLGEAELETIAGPGRFENLRRVGPMLSRADAAVLAYARGMVHWHRYHRFCSRCGEPTRTLRAGHVRECENRACGHTLFPRTDPAVIVLVGHLAADGSRRCLLGRSPRFPKGVYSTLAGFVEPGEALEDAVAREILEESGIEVDDIRYLGSQPWPFPSSLMLGFHATARTTAIRRGDNELEDARWFSTGEIRAAGEWGEDAPLCLPRRDSIARFLIERWLAESGPG